MKTLAKATLLLAGLMTLSVLPAAVADDAPVSDAPAAVQPDPTTEADTSLRFDVIAGFGEDRWDARLAGGVTYRILVDGDGSSDLDLYVYDENGNLVGVDQDSTDFCVVRITPRWTGPFKVVIKNRGRSANRYRLEITP